MTVRNYEDARTNKVRMNSSLKGEGASCSNLAVRYNLTHNGIAQNPGGEDKSLKPRGEYAMCSNLAVRNKQLIDDNSQLHC